MTCDDAHPRRLELWASAARRAWPSLRLDEAAFLRHLSGCAEANEERAADLYLAFGCARADAAALREFESTVLPPALAAAKRTVRAELLDEVRQQVRERLFLSAGDRPPRICEYRGDGPLIAWVGTIAVRVALDLLRRAAPGHAPELSDELEAPGEDPELAYIRAHYGAELKAAFSKVLAALPRRDRAALRLHYLEGLTTDALAKLYDVHRLTISRWLVRIRQQLFEETRRGLAERLKLSEDELGSALRLIRSHVDASLRELLKSRPSEP